MPKVEIKQPIVDEIKKYSENASSSILINYQGLTVEQDTKLRKELREAGVVYKVYKNTLLKRAFEGTDFAQLDNDLEGPTAIAFSYEDTTAAARIISKNAKDFKKLEIRSGVVEGNYYDIEGMKEIAAIPGREELISRLLGSLNSPIANLARVIKQIAEKDGEAPAAEASAEA